MDHIEQAAERLVYLVGPDMLHQVRVSDRGSLIFDKGLFKGKCLMIVRTPTGAYFEILKDKRKRRKKA